MMEEKFDMALLSHHKCATNWQRSICRTLELEGLISVTLVGGKLLQEQEVNDGIRVLLNVNASGKTTEGLNPGAQPVVHFIRDPRDAFVSNYWSWRKSHAVSNPEIARFRDLCADMSVEAGMLELVDLFPMGRQLGNWSDALWGGALPVRYEDMLADFDTSLRAIFSPAGLKLDDGTVTKVREKTAFEKVTGRPRGEERVSEHFRKGVAGDWENYFTEPLRKRFFDKWGPLGERLGYW
jgi:hypothetical protein